MKEYKSTAAATAATPTEAASDAVTVAAVAETTTTTTAGTDASSGASSRTDSAFERQRCHTGGQQQKHSTHNNSSSSNNNWRPYTSKKCTSRPRLNEHRTSRFNNNWNNYNSRDFHQNQANYQNNNWQKNSNSNSRDSFRPYPNSQRPQRQSVNDQQDRSDYYRNVSANRPSSSRVANNASENSLQSKRSSNYHRRWLNESPTDWRKETESNVNEENDKNGTTRNTKNRVNTNNDDQGCRNSPVVNQNENTEQNNSDINRSKVKHYSQEQSNAANKNNLNTQSNERTEEHRKDWHLRRRNPSENTSRNTNTFESKRTESKDKSKEQNNPNKAKSIRINNQNNLDVNNSGTKRQKITTPSANQHELLTPSKSLETTTSSKKSESTYPTIQVRPLAELLKQEILVVTQEQQVEEISSKSLPRQIPQIRRRTISSSYINSNSGADDNGELSINDRLANMDKESLKYIINNSDTIFNEHLKLQARRRLRDEIRRQSKEIKIDQQEDKPVKELIEDEIVDAIKLPHIFLKHIENYLGIDITVPEVERSTRVNDASPANTEQQHCTKDVSDGEQSANVPDSSETCCKDENKARNIEQSSKDCESNTTLATVALSEESTVNVKEHEHSNIEGELIPLEREQVSDKAEQSKERENIINHVESVIERNEAVIKFKQCTKENEQNNKDGETSEQVLKENSSSLMTRRKTMTENRSLNAKVNKTVKSPTVESTITNNSGNEMRSNNLSVSGKGFVRDAEKSSASPSKVPIIKMEKATNVSYIRGSSVIVLSSSEDEHDEPIEKMDDAASDRSPQSNCSNDSEKRRYQQKLKTDADNVVDNFEKLILPQLKETLAERYRSSHCTNLQTRLHFISCVVTSSEHNPQTFTKIQVAKIQQNLKTADNQMGIEFLLREIVNVVNLQKQTALARRKQSAPNELITTPPLNALNGSKNAELASETHQSDSNDIEAAETATTPARALLTPTPPIGNDTPTPTSTIVAISTQHQYVMPLCISHLHLDPSLPQIAPNKLNEHMLILNDPAFQNLVEIDRRLVENQNRRSFLEDMILKFQNEKLDLETVNVELESRKILLLNSVFTRSRAAANPLPINSAPPAESDKVLSTPIAKPGKRKQRQLRAVVLKRVKILPKRRPPAKRLRSNATPNVADTCNNQAALMGDKAPPSTEQRKQSTGNSITQSVTTQLHIKEETSQSDEASLQYDRENEVESKRDTTNSSVVGSPTQHRLSRSSSRNAIQQPLTVIPPLPPPPAPPEPIANLSYELARMPRKSTPPSMPSTEEHSGTTAENFNYIPSGRLHNITSPITQIRIYKVYIIAASENGDVYMFNIGNHKLERQITKHSEAITNMFLCESESYLYTTSLDGFLKKSSLENLEREIHTIYFKEPLQSIDIAWGIVFIGSRWGNLFTYNIASNKVLSMPILHTGQSIIAVKATKEGVRRIILLGCKGNNVFLHDAANGLLLRRLSVPEGHNVYSLLLSDGHVYCGTQKSEVYKFDFGSGTLTTTLNCGNGAVAMVTYGDKFLLVGCYDGFIYVLNKETGMQLGRFSGPGRLVLALAIAGDKVVTSSKDNSLEILEIPPELLC